VPSRNVGSKRARTNDFEIPAELAKREPQDRPASKSGMGRARSPVDAMHGDAPPRQKNTRGHQQKRANRFGSDQDQ
jgi:hypothetical protein